MEDNEEFKAWKALIEDFVTTLHNHPTPEGKWPYYDVSYKLIKVVIGIMGSGVKESITELMESVGAIGLTTYIILGARSALKDQNIEEADDGRAKFL